jgi:hypothetical protein
VKRKELEEDHFDHLIELLLDDKVFPSIRSLVLLYADYREIHCLHHSMQFFVLLALMGVNHDALMGFNNWGSALDPITELKPVEHIILHLDSFPVELFVPSLFNSPKFLRLTVQCFDLRLKLLNLGVELIFFYPEITL